MAHLLYWSPFGHEKQPHFFAFCFILFSFSFPHNTHTHTHTSTLRAVLTNMFAIIIIPFALICCWCCCCCVFFSWMRSNGIWKPLHALQFNSYTCNQRAIFDFHLHSTSCNAPIFLLLLRLYFVSVTFNLLVDTCNGLV